jgi:excinuclease ABC subunit A
VEEAHRRPEKAVLHGHPTEVHVRYRNRYGRERSYYTAYEGVIPFLERRHQEAESDTSRERFEGYMREVPCGVCHGRPAQARGARGDAGRQVDRRGRRHVHRRLRGLPARARADRAAGRHRRAGRQGGQRAARLPARRGARLPVARPGGRHAGGGEAQRIRLATQIGSGLVGVLYVLDEPSIGLHQRDNRRLIETLLRLKSLGNTLIVVEHDEDTINTADWVVDIGPGAGEHGGQVVVSGSVEDLLASPDSITGMYLSGRREIAVPPCGGRPPRAASWSSSAPASTTCAT